MNSPIETGLFLPIRFYETLTEQNRYKRISTGVALIDEIYIYADCKYLLPFQVVFFQDSTTSSIAWTLICSDTGEETILPYNASEWETYNNQDFEWISYIGITDLSGLLSNGKFYIKLEITNILSEVKEFYSDEFVIRNCSAYYDENNYRLTSPNKNDRRLIDTTNLRITKNL